MRESLHEQARMADGSDVDGFVEACESASASRRRATAEAILQAAPPDQLYLGLDRWSAKGGRVP